MSSPHPEGVGAVRAMREALASAGLAAADIDCVNLHGTAPGPTTRRRIWPCLRSGAGAACSSTKGWTGHTLGTSGALEAVIAALCIERGSCRAA